MKRYTIVAGVNGFVTVAKYKNGELQPVGSKQPARLTELRKK